MASSERKPTPLQNRLIGILTIAMGYDLDPLLTKRVNDFRKGELAKVSRSIIGYVAIPLVVGATYIDFSFGEIHTTWILCRLGFVHFGSILVYSYRFKFTKTNPGIPVFLMVSYCLGFLLYFVSQTGYQRSSYWNGIIQLVFIVAVFPLSWAEFLIIYVGIIALSISTVVLFSGSGIATTVQPDLLRFLNTYIPQTILSFYILYSLRFALYKKTIQLNDEVASRDAEIHKKANDLVEAKLDLATEQLKVAHLDELTTMAAQVSHDIRSPLAALNMLATHFDMTLVEQRTIAKSAIGRITDISHQLLEKSKGYYQQMQGLRADKALENPVANSAPKLSINTIYPIIESIVAEKRMEYRDRKGITLNLEPQSGEEILANIDASELKRLLSNLINNAVEAIDGRGEIRLSLRAADDIVVIDLEDNGKGIPPDTIPLLMNRGATFLKEGGSGLGLFHAKATLRQWGGDLVISSVLGKGTKVRITLPGAASIR